MKLWSGRFSRPIDAGALAFSSSLPLDRRLVREDIEGSLAHVAMLAKQKIIPAADARRIRSGLLQILRDVSRGKVPADFPRGASGRFVAEDIHMAVEQRLISLRGAAGERLHTARSRNDQVALDERLYLRGSVREIVRAIRTLQKAFVSKAARYENVVMPGYTHLQRAQPILLAHHLLAYVSMLDRDRERFDGCLSRIERSPLGAVALAGTSLPIDRRNVARGLGFSGIVENSIDAVSDRDVVIEWASSCAITMMHLSRFAEETVLWSTEEWGFVEIGDEFTTGSSVMPQKKNPDIAELIRGKTGSVYGHLVALLTIMKGLPLSYNRDMQEDKEPLLRAGETLIGCLRMAAGMLASMRFQAARFETERQSDFLLATDLAEYLVRKGMPFRRAHASVAKIVRTCQEREIALKQLPLKEYRRFSTLFEKDVFSLLDLRRSLRAKRSEGSTSPREVGKSLRTWRRRLSMSSR